MPITSSAKKALRRDLRREKQNQKVKKQFRNSIRKFEENPTKKNLKNAYSEIDKAAKKYVIHKNKASRLKSKLAKRLKNKLNSLLLYKYLLTPYTRNVDTARNQNINLIPKEELEKTTLGRILKWALSIGRYIILFIELIAIGCFLFRFKLDLERKKLDKEIRAKQQTVLSYEEFEKEVRNLHAKISTVADLNAQNNYLATLPNKVAEVTPKDVVFQTLNLKGKKIYIEGYSLSNYGFKVFLDGLQKEEDFADITLNKLNSGGTKNPKTEFTINITLK